MKFLFYSVFKIISFITSKAFIEVGLCSCTVDQTIQNQLTWVGECFAIIMHSSRWWLRSLMFCQLAKKRPFSVWRWSNCIPPSERPLRSWLRPKNLVLKFQSFWTILRMQLFWLISHNCSYSQLYHIYKKQQKIWFWSFKLLPLHFLLLQSLFICTVRIRA